MKDKTAEKEGSQAAKHTAYYRQTIESLKLETNKLKEQMSLESTAPLPVGTESYIARLQDQEDTYIKKIKLEKAKRKDLDRRLAEVQKKIAEKRISLAMPKDNQIKETNETILLKIKKAEHKIDKTLQKYNEVLARNKHLRDEIDELRKERKISEDIIKSLDIEFATLKEEEHKLNDIQQKLKGISRKGNSMLRAKRDFKKEAQGEIDNFEKEWKEVNKILEKDINSEDLFIQCEKISTPATEEKESEGTETIGSPNDGNNERSCVRDAVKKVEMFSEAFKKLQEVAGTSDVEDLVKIFVEAEKHNYSLFSHVNDLTNDIQTLDAQIQEMKNEIAYYTNIGKFTACQKEITLSQLGSKLTLAENRTNSYEKRLEKTMKIMKDFKIGVQGLLEKVGAGDLITEEGVSEANLMQLLGVIELRTNEILQMFKICQKSANESPIDSIPIEDEEKKPLKIVPPEILAKDQEEDEKEPALSVLSQQELLTKAKLMLENPKK
ncbi:hypothetical protein SteCoe_22858 [Stentor coeruleus]|uniref:ODAD1 central coiled coil region domain-containing protein n=1 Tax=Stentor coeruleus TaxID=5963 RepID=A0A1R2BL37_9CILI|nr:hypothetical protein SteCoe_22858 [Stentor coeruleus]